MTKMTKWPKQLNWPIWPKWLKWPERPKWPNWPKSDEQHPSNCGISNKKLPQCLQVTPQSDQQQTCWISNKKLFKCLQVTSQSDEQHTCWISNKKLLKCLQMTSRISEKKSLCIYSLIQFLFKGECSECSESLNLDPFSTYFLRLRGVQQNLQTGDGVQLRRLLVNLACK